MLLLVIGWYYYKNIHILTLDSKNYIIFPKIIFQSNDLIISEYIEGESFDNLTDMQKSKTSINWNTRG